MRYARARIPRKRLWVRALGVLACVALGLLSWRLWYGDKELYDAQSADGVFNCEHESERSASRGLLWSFLHSVSPRATATRRRRSCWRAMKTPTSPPTSA